MQFLLFGPFLGIDLASLLQGSGGYEGTQTDSLRGCGGGNFLLLALNVVGCDPLPDRTGQSPASRDFFLPHECILTPLQLEPV
jgi:hypothetical protein